MLVRDVMRKPISVHAEETLEVATLRLKKENVGALPVVEDDQVVGMITDRDILLRGFPEGRNIPHQDFGNQCRLGQSYAMKKTHSSTPWS